MLRLDMLQQFCAVLQRELLSPRPSDVLPGRALLRSGADLLRLEMLRQERPVLHRPLLREDANLLRPEVLR
jgi:hypothetical protein